eukprot:TCALIF_05563-PA protein Name:"Similar to ak1 Adenylate kinase isoenzyme 1 (Cyprinus carpio)" AED:0.08 eAED:0.08 QI:317/0.5/0.66/1/1/1/3/901/220
MANVERKTVDKSPLKGIPIVWIIGSRNRSLDPYNTTFQSISLLGGPGSGKGTQCELIHIKFGFRHLSTGDLLRHEVLSGSTRGTQLYKLMSTGECVPYEIVDDILAEAMVAKVAKGFVLDGFPLDLEQAQAFEKDIGSPKAIIFIEANDTVLEERLLARGNFDDNKTSIEKRLHNFYTKTVPVVEHYGDLVKRINAERPKEEVFADVQKVMESLSDPVSQ